MTMECTRCWVSERTKWGNTVWGNWGTLHYTNILRFQRGWQKSVQKVEKVLGSKLGGREEGVNCSSKLKPHSNSTQMLHFYHFRWELREQITEQNISFPQAFYALLLRCLRIEIIGSNKVIFVCATHPLSRKLLQKIAHSSYYCIIVE